MSQKKKNASQCVIHPIDEQFDACDNAAVIRCWEQNYIYKYLTGSRYKDLIIIDNFVPTKNSISGLSDFKI